MSAKSSSPAAPLRPECSSPPQHEAAPEPGADGEEHEVVDAARDALPLLAERREVDVVDERHRRARAGRSGRAPRSAPSNRRKWVRWSRPVGVDDTGHADDGARRSARARGRPPRSATRVTEAIAASAESGVGAGELDVLADPRSSRRGRTRRRGRTGRRDRARARARRRGSARRRPRRSSGRPGSCSDSRTRPAATSDCSASETVGFEIPTRREISAREIGASVRRVSSTVRSFRSLRSGGVARGSAVCGHLVRNPNGKRPLIPVS